jgi:hypothetical protein
VLVSDRDPLVPFSKRFRDVSEHVSTCRQADTRRRLPNGARQQLVSLGSTLFLLLRWFKLDMHVASSGIRVQRYSRARNLAHPPFEANFGFSLEEPHELLLRMRPSIPVSEDALERLRLLQEVHTLVRSVVYLHKDAIQARSEPSIAPHFVQGDKTTVITKSIFLREPLNRKLRDRQLGVL